METSGSVAAKNSISIEITENDTPDTNNNNTATTTEGIVYRICLALFTTHISTRYLFVCYLLLVIFIIIITIISCCHWWCRLWLELPCSQENYSYWARARYYGWSGMYVCYKQQLTYVWHSSLLLLWDMCDNFTNNEQQEQLLSVFRFLLLFLCRVWQLFVKQKRISSMVICRTFW